MLILPTAPRNRAIPSLGVLALVVGLRFLVGVSDGHAPVAWTAAVGTGLSFGGTTAVLLSLGLEARRAKRSLGS